MRFKKCILVDHTDHFSFLQRGILLFVITTKAPNEI